MSLPLHELDDPRKWDYGSHRDDYLAMISPAAGNGRMRRKLLPMGGGPGRQLLGWVGLRSSGQEERERGNRGAAGRYVSLMIALIGREDGASVPLSPLPDHSSA